MIDAHGHHIAAAGDQAIHHHHYRLFRPQAAGFNVKLLAGRGPAAGGGQLNHHALKGRVAAGIIQIGGDDGGGVLAQPGKGNVDDADFGLAGGHIEKDIVAGGQAQHRQRRSQDVPTH